MTEPYLGEIQLFGFDFAPLNWALCSGQIMPIQQNTTLYSLLGAQYGGNGQTNFALPNFGGNAANSQGEGPGLTPRVVGEIVGQPRVMLLPDEMPRHTHTAQIYMARGTPGRVNTPAPGVAPSNPTTAQGFVTDGQPDTPFAPLTLYPTGGNLPHNNQQPFLTVNYCIALRGVFPNSD